MPEQESETEGPQFLGKFTNESGRVFNVYNEPEDLSHLYFYPVMEGNIEGARLKIKRRQMRDDMRVSLENYRDFDARERPEFKRRTALMSGPPE